MWVDRFEAWQKVKGIKNELKNMNWMMFYNPSLLKFKRVM